MEVIIIISLYEIDYLYESEILSDYLENSKVKKLIDKSKKLIKELNKDNIKQFMDDNRGLFNDSAVKGYIDAAGRVGVRNGWIKGGFVGAALGLLTGSSIAAYAGISVAIISLLGAIIGGLTIGYPMSKLLQILYRWQAEEDVTQGRTGGILNIHSGNINHNNIAVANK